MASLCYGLPEEKNLTVIDDRSIVADMQKATREHILACGGNIIHHKGFSACGLQEILQAAGVPKGSFYFYFKSKEEFGLALVDHFQAKIGQQVGPILKDRSLPPLQRLSQFFLWFQDYFGKEGYIKGCPIGNLIQELGDVQPVFREKLNASLNNLIHIFIRLLREAQERGELSDSLEPEPTARYILSAWQGALIRMKAVAGPEPLETFYHMTFNVLLA